MNFATSLNELGKRREPFFFAVNYAKSEFIVLPLKSMGKDILYTLEGLSNAGKNPFTCKEFILRKEPLLYANYLEKFESVIEQIKSGNTYLLNLTSKTKISNDMDMEEAFYSANAPFKLYIKDRFVCFSPERFVKIEGNSISTYPMKGTIDATILDAEALILADEKEMAEHVMVVDLLRNDLSMVAKEVRVEAFRYVEKIQAGERELLHVSSKIVGKVEDDWHEKIGDMLSLMLPAGSISGTPKKKSIEIIEAIEAYDRGFFSGVFGIYDGENLDSAVMIRFLEKGEEGYVFKSGGGITLLSEPQKEYDEMCAKVYIPSF
ncbi:MAG: aminodeoxychorismate synthase component I [Campylobacteraceae bacterium]|nr:aminodeoxychorismate synthase component I [Campylobacteraceae bacterium]